ncbi:MAG TPA: TonB-dependent receptor [Terriglobia bacterium]|nr:TonB-dependent receptor [Terriglobia bacterium]
MTNEGTNLTISTTSGADGSYLFTPVRIGTYAVAAEATGFQKVTQVHLTLNIDQQLVVNLTLKPGAVTQTVEVTAAPPVLQTQSSSVGQVVGSREVNDLPLNGRNFTFLAQLVVGVNTPQADTRGNAATGAFAANGLRPAQNNYLLDGIDNNEDTVDFLNGTNYVVLPPVDAIQEFKVQTSDYSAQYGRSGAAILNATIKSGTNDLHGDLFEFFRNDKLDAADFFEDSGGVQKGEFRLNQFGFTVGGPVVIPHVYDGHNKLFFFGDYEGTRRRQGGVFTTSVPTPLERSSGFTNLSDLITGQAGSGTHTDDLGRTVPFGTVFDPATTRAVTAGQVDPVSGLVATGTGYVRDPFGTCAPSTLNFTLAACGLNMIPAGRLDPNALKLLGLFPAANGSSLFGNYTVSPVLREKRDAFDTRLDFNKSEKDQIFGRFSYVNDPQFIPGPFTGIADGGAFQQGDQGAISIQGALSWTHTFSGSTINEARLGENRIRTSRFGPVATQFGIPAQYGISSSIPQCCENGGLPAFGISGLNTLGSNAFLPSDEVSQTTQVTDNFTKIYGKHSFKAGMEYQHVKYSTLQPPWSHGQYNYDGVYTNIPDGPTDNTGPAQFVLLPCPGPTPAGTPSGCPSIPNAVPNVGGTDAVFTSNISLTDDGKNYWGTYFEDDWKITSKLTLNLGVRWDYFGQTYEHFGAQANWVPGAPGTGTALGTGAQYLIPSKRKGDVLSPSFIQLMAQDGIAVKYIDNPSLGVSQKTNFSPRVGFAYQISPKLVARGGYGIFYGGFENRGFSPNIGENYPFQFNFSFFNPNGETPISAATFPSFAGTPCANAFSFESGFDCTPLQTSLVQASGLSLRGIQYNYQTPYTMGYNLTFQYEIAPSTTLSLGYVGNTARHLEVFPGANEVSQVLLPNTNIFATSAPGKGLYIPYPDFGSGGSYAATEGDSYYHSLQTSLEKHYSNGMNFLGTYTYSRCRSDSGDLLNGGSIGYRAPYIPGFGIQHDYGDCDFDIRHVVHFSGGYELPLGKGKRYLSSSSGAVNQILGGWSTQGIVTLEGGQPMTLGCAQGTAASVGCNDFIIPGVDRHGSGAPDHFLNAAAFTQPCPPAGFTQPTRCVPGISGIGLLGGANSQVSGPAIGRLDFSLFKNFQITERYRMELRSEFFNILNHPTFNAPGFGGNGVVAIGGSTDYTNSNFGKIGSTRFPFNDPRQIQFALKLYF